MPGFSRLAVGSWGCRPDVGPLTWGLAALLERHGRQVRHFFSRACYCSPQGALAATGTSSGYLDPWLLSTDACRRRLAEAYATADFMLAEGCFARHEASLPIAAGARPNCGDLDALANRLDLPRIIVLEAAQAVDCRLPSRPDAVDGVLLDGVRDYEQFVRMQTCIEGVWGVPVVGALEQDEGLRQRIACLPAGRLVPADVVDAITARMCEYLQLDALMKIAHRPTLPQPTSLAGESIFVEHPPTIAVAYDDAFCGYFSDTLERLEGYGARVVDFSPLLDETLPEAADVVLIGCGRPEEFAERLSENVCMLSALRDYARRGGSIYAEGGGTAYLSRSLTVEDGRSFRMVDALPLAARHRREPLPPEPVEFTFERECRLAPVGTVCRAYRGGRYDLTPLEALTPLGSEIAADLFAVDNVVAGRLQLNFAAHDALMRRLLERRDPTRSPLAEVG
jgi:cobyrinic acid a,c-diamide synthase